MHEDPFDLWCKSEDVEKLETAMTKAYQLHIQGDVVIAREILRVALGISITEQAERLEEYNV